MNKQQYKEIEMEVIHFDRDDVIVTSGPENPASCGWVGEIIPVPK